MAAEDDLRQNSWGQFIFENDAFGVLEPTDDGYSNGVGYAWGKAPIANFDDIDMPDWVRWTSDWTYINQADRGQYTLSYAILQGMFTPSDLEDSQLIPDDRPYAGVLLWQVKLRQFEDNVATSLLLDVGVVGPASLAEQTQSIIHGMIGAKDPQGWDNQIDNEPVFRVQSEYLYRFAQLALSNSVATDVSFYTQAGIGNLRSDAGFGLTFRVGSGLDETYASINPTASHSANPYAYMSDRGFNWMLFMSAYGRYVLNDITIDGNTFKDSHSVELIHEQGQLSMGFAMRWGSWGILFSTLRGSQQYEGQIPDTNYGAASISYHY
ncbi:lipid A deacylase LpxR family protein [Shewanella gelidimarina]|uniref:lipid A deacylase LpxR family protein n=1 Tax=Shewanella gelidimarina TaxID=56813 RepID=UPI00200DCB0D|nr:lipid A deacylase LpxR family protein [Shewanella gelidimarina]MCL1057682.1 lipid A deacylase LpxR family protein [Shewanella gelidimarina]